MKFTFLSLFFAFFATALPAEDSAEKSAIFETWEEFTSACHERSGETAATYVTEASHQYYAEIQKLATAASKEEVQGLPLGKQVTLLSMRLRIAPEKLMGMSGKGLLVHSIKEGWIGKPRSEDETIAEIEINKNTATARESVGGEITDHVVHFLKEGGKWKFDMLPTITVVDETFEVTCADSGESREDFVEALLKLITGESDVSSAWSPPKLPEEEE